jgi:hypothetical protein
MAVAIPTLAFAADFAGNFSGYADHDGIGPGVYASGTTYVARLILDDYNEAPWYPFDPGKEYTAVMTVVVDTFTDNGGYYMITDFEVGLVEVYEDVTTSADYAAPGTFTDGTLILVGQTNNMIAQGAIMPGMPFAVSGVVVFTGGSGYGNLLGCAPGGLAMNDFIQTSIITPPTGYEETYDAEWKCTQVTGTDASTWGNIKGLYR